MDKKLEEMTIEQLEEAMANPRKSGLTFTHIKALTEMGLAMKKAAEDLEQEKYEKLTWWGKFKSLFSKRPVYKKVN